MKLDRLRMVTQLAQHRNELLVHLNKLDLHVSIGTQAADEDLIALLRPVIEAELFARLRQCELDLEKLGVEI